MRFPGFTDEWKKTTLGNECEIQMCKRILAQQTNPNNGVPFFKIGTIGGNPDAYISLDLFKQFKEKYNYPQQGEILISCAGTVGKCVRFDGAPAYFQDSNIVWPRNYERTYTNDYLFYILSKQDWRHLNTTTIVRIYNDDLRSVKFSYPSIEEQKKITRLLSIVDERIETQNKIIEDLKKLKSAISKSLLSRTDLLERKISIYEIGSLKNGYAFQSSSYNPTGVYEILTIANVTGDRYICTSGCSRILTKPSDLQSHQELKKNDILISMTGNVGRVSLCKDGKYLLNQRVGLLKVNPDINTEFVYQALSSLNFEKTMISCSQGAAQMNIGKGDIENYMLPYSDNPNNLHKIAELLYSYDGQIDIEEKTLQLLNQQKVHLLTSMFI